MTLATFSMVFVGIAIIGFGIARYFKKPQPKRRLPLDDVSQKTRDRVEALGRKIREGEAKIAALEASRTDEMKQALADPDFYNKRMNRKDTK